MEETLMDWLSIEVITQEWGEDEEEASSQVDVDGFDVGDFR